MAIQKLHDAFGAVEKGCLSIVKFIAIVLGLLAVLLILLFVWAEQPWRSTPSIAEGLFGSSITSEKDRIFDVRVGEAFPVPINEDIVIERLIQEGFEVFPEENRASWFKGGFVCGTNLYISLETDGVLVTEIGGSYASSCL
ncbi:MAG: hypothetical protein AAF234_05395 [Pseudomonadota bacterium]